MSTSKRVFQIWCCLDLLFEYVLFSDYQEKVYSQKYILEEGNPLIQINTATLPSGMDMLNVNVIGGSASR